MTGYCREDPKGSYSNVSGNVVGTKGRNTGTELGEKGISAYVQEHIEMVNSIQGRGPYVNQTVPIAESTLTCIMARESAYSGQAITCEQIMNSKQDVMPRDVGYEMSTKPTALPVPAE